MVEWFERIWVKNGFKYERGGREWGEVDAFIGGGRDEMQKGGGVKEEGKGWEEE